LVQIHRAPCRRDAAWTLEEGALEGGRVRRLTVLRRTIQKRTDGATRLQSSLPLVRRVGVDEPVWVPTVFTKNRDRLLEADVARKFLAELMDHKELRGLLSDDHFSVDGTQIA
jgi:hypothetical protein